MGRIKAVIFDMDGLMFDTERLAAQFLIQAGMEKGLLIGEEFLSRIRGGSKEEAENWFHKCYGTSYDYWEIRNRKTTLLRAYLDTHEIPVKKGLTELLDYLGTHKYKVILATSTQKSYTKQYLLSAGVRDCFDDLICGDMVSRYKPDPEIFLKAAEKAGAQPFECVVLEDSLNGIEAAVRGGFFAVMVPDISRPSKELQEKLAAECENLLEVIDYLERQDRKGRA